MTDDCLLERGERVPGSQPCSSKAAVYEDHSSCLAKKVAVVSDMYMCMHMHIVICGRAPAWADLVLYSLLYIPLYRKLLYKAEHRCIRRYTAGTRCVTALHSYSNTAIQRLVAIHYTAVQRYTLYNLYLLSPSAPTILLELFKTEPEPPCRETVRG